MAANLLAEPVLAAAAGNTSAVSKQGQKDSPIKTNYFKLFTDFPPLSRHPIINGLDKLCFLTF
jgi:hypothetical protein